MGGDRSRLRSTRLERRFQRDGYVVAPLGASGLPAQALQVFGTYDSGIDAGYYVSLYSIDNTYKQDVDTALTTLLWPSLDDLLVDHRSLVGAFMVKPPTGSTVVPVHQDWNTMEESPTTAGITCWMPLTPITDLEGRMHVLPGSHRYIGGLRGSPGFPAPYQQIREEIRDELMVTVDVKVGEVLIMDGRVLHSTDQNRSGRNRVVAYINAVPTGTRPLHYYRREDGIVEGYWVDRSFFTTFNIGERPPGEPFTVIADYAAEELTIEDVRAGAQAHRPRTSAVAIACRARPWRRTWWSSVNHRCRRSVLTGLRAAERRLDRQEA